MSSETPVDALRPADLSGRRVAPDEPVPVSRGVFRRADHGHVAAAVHGDVGPEVVLMGRAVVAPCPEDLAGRGRPLDQEQVAVVPTRPIGVAHRMDDVSPPDGDAVGEVLGMEGAVVHLGPADDAADELRQVDVVVGDLAGDEGDTAAGERHVVGLVRRVAGAGDRAGPGGVGAVVDDRRSGGRRASKQRQRQRGEEEARSCLSSPPPGTPASMRMTVHVVLHRIPPGSSSARIAPVDSSTRSAGEETPRPVRGSPVPGTVLLTTRTARDCAHLCRYCLVLGALLDQPGLLAAALGVQEQRRDRPRRQRRGDETSDQARASSSRRRTWGDARARRRRLVHAPFLDGLGKGRELAPEAADAGEADRSRRARQARPPRRRLRVGAGHRRPRSPAARMAAMSTICSATQPSPRDPAEGGPRVARSGGFASSGAELVVTTHLG